MILPRILDLKMASNSGVDSAREAVFMETTNEFPMEQKTKVQGYDFEQDLNDKGEV